MTAFVVDASITLAWCFEDESTPYTDGVLRSLETGQAHAPTLWSLEVLNALLTAKRKNRLTESQFTQKLAFLRALPIALEPIAATGIFEDVMRLAEEHALSSYDAAYLELALRLGLPLATLDGSGKRQGLKHAALRCRVLHDPREGS